MKLKRIAYYSKASASLTIYDCEDMVNTASTANWRRGISGVLVYSQHSFFQVIEGECDKIDALFAKISKDSRHYDVNKVMDEEISTRLFAGWKAEIEVVPLSRATDDASYGFAVNKAVNAR